MSSANAVANTIKTQVESTAPIEKVKGAKIHLESCRWIWPQTLELAIRAFKAWEKSLISSF